MAALLGFSMAELRANGWLIGEVSNGRGPLWPPLSPALLSQVNWSIIFRQVGNILAIIVVSVISLLLNNEGLELATERDLEVNRELQAAGLANLLTGLAAGLVGYKMLSLSTLNFKLGGSSRLPGIIAALICILVLLFGAAIIAVFPKVVIGSLLLLLGLNFLFAWVFEGLLKMPKIDYAIVLDFKRVSGLDSTGMLRFQRMKQLAQTEDFILVFTEPNKRVMAQLEQGGFADDGRRVRIFSSLDKGVAWCEDRLLAASSLIGRNTDSLIQIMRDLLHNGENDRQKDARLAALFGRLEKFEVDAGYTLIKKGDPPDDLYFIDSGRVTAQLPRSGQPPIRLESSGSGKVIGEIGFYLGSERTADVVADTPCVL